METYHKIQTLFKRDMDGSRTGQKGKMIRGEWTTPELKYLADNVWEFTEKVDGTNIRIGFHRYQDTLDVEIAGRSDNAVLPKPLLAKLQEMFPSSPRGSGDGALVGRWMLDHDLTDVKLFGEGYGAKIQNGGNYRSDQSFVLFDVKIGEFWLDRANVDDVAEKLGLESVPVIGRGTLHDAISLVNGTADSSWNRGPHGGVLKSTWGDFEAEGIVARPLVPLFDRKGQRIITKIKAVDFK